jgi:hypothetical protein
MNLAPSVERTLLNSIFAVVRPAVRVLTSPGESMRLPPMVSRVAPLPSSEGT